MTDTEYSDADLENWVAHHPPSSPDIIEAHQIIRKRFGNLLLAMNELLPESEHKKRALFAILDAMQRCNTTIALTQQTLDIQRVEIIRVKPTKDWAPRPGWTEPEGAPGLPGGAKMPGTLHIDESEDRVFVWRNGKWTADPAHIHELHPEFPPSPHTGDEIGRGATVVYFQGEHFVYKGGDNPGWGRYNKPAVEAASSSEEVVMWSIYTAATQDDLGNLKAMSGTPAYVTTEDRFYVRYSSRWTKESTAFHRYFVSLPEFPVHGQRGMVSGQKVIYIGSTSGALPGWKPYNHETDQSFAI